MATVDEAGQQQRLVERAKRGDRDAFMALVRPLLPDLHQSAYYLARDADEAQDLAQQACLRAWQALHTFKPEAPLRPWLQRILRNVFLDRRKSAAARHEIREPEDGGLSPPTEAATPLEALLAQENQEALTAHIRALPPTFQEILVLCDIQELSYAEVCDVTQLPLGTVKSRLSRARLMLRERLVGAREPSGVPSRRSKRGHS